MPALPEALPAVIGDFGLRGVDRNDFGPYRGKDLIEMGAPLDSEPGSRDQDRF
jgi:hypothetical protein